MTDRELTAVESTAKKLREAEQALVLAMHRKDDALIAHAFAVQEAKPQSSAQPRFCRAWSASVAAPQGDRLPTAGPPPILEDGK